MCIMYMMYMCSIYQSMVGYCWITKSRKSSSEWPPPEGDTPAAMFVGV